VSAIRPLVVPAPCVDHRLVNSATSTALLTVDQLEGMTIDHRIEHQVADRPQRLGCDGQCEVRS